MSCVQTPLTPPIKIGAIGEHERVPEAEEAVDDPIQTAPSLGPWLTSVWSVVGSEMACSVGERLGRNYRVAALLGLPVGAFEHRRLAVVVCVDQSSQQKRGEIGRGEDVLAAADVAGGQFDAEGDVGVGVRCYECAQ